MSDSVAMKEGSRVKLFSLGWQVPQVLPLPLNVSLKKIFFPFVMSSLSELDGRDGDDWQAESVSNPSTTAAAITGFIPAYICFLYFMLSFLLPFFSLGAIDRAADRISPLVLKAIKMPGQAKVPEWMISELYFGGMPTRFSLSQVQRTSTFLSTNL
ncbi:MAG: hypothetical protein ACREIQ_03695 [Nitrospiria bacterium]